MIVLAIGCPVSDESRACWIPVQHKTLLDTDIKFGPLPKQLIGSNAVVRHWLIVDLELYVCNTKILSIIQVVTSNPWRRWQPEGSACMCMVTCLWQSEVKTEKRKPLTVLGPKPVGTSTSESYSIPLQEETDRDRKGINWKGQYVSMKETKCWYQLQCIYLYPFQCVETFAICLFDSDFSFLFSDRVFCILCAFKTTWREQHQRWDYVGFFFF